MGNHDSTASGTGQDGSSGGIIPGYVDYFHSDPDNLAGRLPTGVLFLGLMTHAGLLARYRRKVD